MVSMNEPEIQKPVPDALKRPDISQFPAAGISETVWRFLILASSAAVLLFSVYCLSHGITTIFMHLYYFPIVLAVCHYRLKGFIYSVLLALAYVALVIFYDWGQAGIIIESLYRFTVFVGIAAVIAFLSEWLFTAHVSLKKSADMRERYLSIAPAIILVLDSQGKITLLNRHGCAILGCTFEQVKDRYWIDTFIGEDQRERVRSVFGEILAGNIDPYQVAEDEVVPLTGPARIFRWHNTVIRDEAGVITGTLSYGEDVTEKKYTEDTIRELQQFQESVIRNANVWIMVLSPEGIVLLWNDAAEAISGYKKDEVLGSSSVWKRMYPEQKYRLTVTSEIKWIIDRDTYLEDFETSIRCTDGEEKTISWNTKGLRDSHGVVTSYIAIGRDVTRWKHAETALRERDALLNEVGMMALIGGWELDVETEQTRWTKEIYLIYDIGEEEIFVLDKAILFFDKPDRFRLESAVRRCMETGEPFDLELPFTSAKGRHLWTRVVGRAVKADGMVVKLKGTFQDITISKEVADALRASEEAYRDLVENINDVIYTINDAGDVTFANSAVARIIGYTPEEVRGKNIRDIIHPDDLPVELTRIEEIKRGIIKPSDWRAITKDGEIRWVRSVSQAIFQDGRYAGLHGVVSDITERKLAEEAIRESENKFRQIFDKANDGIEIVEIQDNGYPGRYIDVNEVACRMLQYSKEEMLQHSPLDFDTESLSQHFSEIINESETLGHVTFESGHRRKDGTIVPVEINTHIITLLGKKVSLSIVRDITERKKTEEALRESEYLYRTLSESSPELILIFTLEGRLTYINEYGCSMLGKKYDEIVGQTLGDFFPPEVNSRQMVNIRSMATTGLPLRDSTVPVPGPSGMRTFDTWLIPLKSPEGVVTSILGISRDITELKEKEEALRESRQILEGIINTIPIRVFWKDKNLTFLGCNTPFARDAGFEKPEEIIGRDDYAMSWREQAELYRSDDRAVIESGMPKFMIEEPQTTPTGETITLLTSKLPLLDARGDVVGVLGTYMDITERKRAEEALVLVNKKLNMLNSITRHDILNKLMGLRAYLELCKNEMKSPGVMEYLQGMEQAAEAIQRQIEFTRNYQDIGVQSPKWQILADIINSAVLQIDPRGIAVKADAGDAEIYADPLLEKVFYNLMDNSLRHGGHVTRVDISVRDTGDGLVIAYCDDGVGISANDKEKLFRKGFGKHTGLGLFLSKEILSITGIIITENGVPGEGVRFEILVPKRAYRFTSAS